MSDQGLQHGSDETPWIASAAGRVAGGVRARWVIGALAVPLALLVAARAVDRSVAGRNDFDNFYDAAASVWQTGALFDEKSTDRYPPSFQVLLAPLGALPRAWAAVVWTLASYLALAVLPEAFRRLSGGTGWRGQRLAWFVALPFVVDNLILGQSGIWLLALCAWGMVACAGPVRSSALAALGSSAIALAGFVKVFPGALALVPLGLGRARAALVGGAAATLAMVLLLAAVLGPRTAFDESLDWAGRVRQEESAARLIEVPRSLRYNNQALPIVIHRTLSDFNPLPQLAARGSVQLASWPMAVGWAIYGVLLAAVWGLVAAAVWRARTRAGPREFLALFALVSGAVLTLPPVVWTHYFIWLLPAAIYLADRHRWLAGIGVASLVASLTELPRGLGFHMFLNLALMLGVARRLWRET